ncbi:carbon-nitrogen hydrolase family protein [Colwelliaceae bacterium 6441]
MVRVSAIQLTSTPNVEENIANIEQQLSAIASHQNHLVVLPECCLYFGGRDAEQVDLAKATSADNTLVRQLANLANKYSITLVAGSIPLYQAQTQKFTNTCCVFSPQGELISEYSKIHLFDVNVDDNEKTYCESRYTQAGDQVKTADFGDIKVGLTVCYDLRFPELYRQLTTLGAKIITVPSAFTKVTGKAHWQTLLRARAIENQVYIVAAGQQGEHANGRETWGHSMIISPWGDIIACREEGQGIITADIDLNDIDKVRKAIPVAEHNRFTTKLKHLIKVTS